MPTSVPPLIVVVAVVASPMVSAVAAPAKFTVVAVVFRRANVLLPVVRLVVNWGDVPKTSNPVPVSSLMTPASSADVVAENALNLSAVRATVPVLLGRVMVLLEPVGSATLRVVVRPPAAVSPSNMMVEPVYVDRSGLVLPR